MWNPTISSLISAVVDLHEDSSFVAQRLFTNSISVAHISSWVMFSGVLWVVAAVEWVTWALMGTVLNCRCTALQSWGNFTQINMTLILLIVQESQPLHVQGIRYPLISPSDMSTHEALLVPKGGVLWMDRFEFRRKILKSSVIADLYERSGSTNQVSIMKSLPWSFPFLAIRIWPSSIGRSGSEMICLVTKTCHCYQMEKSSEINLVDVLTMITMLALNKRELNFLHDKPIKHRASAYGIKL